MEVDKDHIHYMIETRPNINLSDFVRTIKGYIVYHIWEKYSVYFTNVFRKKKHSLQMDIPSVIDNTSKKL